MLPDASESKGSTRLRFVFGDTVLSFDANADVTFGEIARVLAGLSPSRYGHPVTIDVTLRRGFAIAGRKPIGFRPQAAR